MAVSTDHNSFEERGEPNRFTKHSGLRGACVRACVCVHACMRACVSLPLCVSFCLCLPVLPACVREPVNGSLSVIVPVFCLPAHAYYVCFSLCKPEHVGSSWVLVLRF